MERLRSRVTPDPQQEIIERYCEEARRLLGKTASREEALAIKARVCTQLAQECESPLILGATQSYVDRLIRTMWEKTKGDNHT